VLPRPQCGVCLRTSDGTPPTAWRGCTAPRWCSTPGSPQNGWFIFNLTMEQLMTVTRESHCTTVYSPTVWSGN